MLAPAGIGGSDLEGCPVIHLRFQNLGPIHRLDPAIDLVRSGSRTIARRGQCDSGDDGPQKEPAKHQLTAILAIIFLPSVPAGK